MGGKGSAKRRDPPWHLGLSPNVLFSGQLSWETLLETLPHPQVIASWKQPIIRSPSHVAQSMGGKKKTWGFTVNRREKRYFGSSLGGFGTLFLQPDQNGNGREAMCCTVPNWEEQLLLWEISRSLLDLPIGKPLLCRLTARAKRDLDWNNAGGPCSSSSNSGHPLLSNS